MDDYETEVARQPGGPFSNRQERKTIRRVAEHWVEGRRYSQERTRRFKAYATWVGLAVPFLLAIIKIVEALGVFGK